VLLASLATAVSPVIQVIPDLPDLRDKVAIRVRQDLRETVVRPE
jgi:hypothetical protein